MATKIATKALKSSKSSKKVLKTQKSGDGRVGDTAFETTVDNCISAIHDCAIALQSYVGEDVDLDFEHPAVEAAIDGKRGVSAAYIASVVSALVAYEQSNGWKHLIAALNLLVRFIKWAWKNRKQKEQSGQSGQSGQSVQEGK